MKEELKVESTSPASRRDTWRLRKCIAGQWLALAVLIIYVAVLSVLWFNLAARLSIDKPEAELAPKPVDNLVRSSETGSQQMLEVHRNISRRIDGNQQRYILVQKIFQDMNSTFQETRDNQSQRFEEIDTDIEDTRKSLEGQIMTQSSQLHNRIQTAIGDQSLQFINYAGRVNKSVTALGNQVEGQVNATRLLRADTDNQQRIGTNTSQELAIVKSGLAELRANVELRLDRLEQQGISLEQQQQVRQQEQQVQQPVKGE